MLTYYLKLYGGTSLKYFKKNLRILNTQRYVLKYKGK